LQDHALKPVEYEQEADRTRAELRSTWAQLRENLTPSNLAEEIAQESGLRDITPAAVFDFGARRHPVPTALIGLGIGLFAFALARRSRSGDRFDGRGSVRNAAGALARSAKDVFRDRAEAKRQALMSAASTHVRAGATQLSEAIENGLDDLVGAIPATPAARPLIESAIQMALLMALESLLPKTP
jgi:hypothetical protein